MTLARRSMSLQVNYKIYPSLLNKFQDLLDYSIVAEEPWNKVSESAQSRGEYLDREVGDYILTPDEMADKIEQELLDSINRVPHEPSEAADKGTAFNEIVDCLIEHRPSSRDDVTIRSVPFGTGKAVEAKINCFTFLFDAQFCKDTAQYFAGCIPQFLCEAVLHTRYGDVLLYGYADEIGPDVVYDIKTTKQYNFGKFVHGWQKDLYPYCLIESGQMEEVKEFEYTVYVWKGGTSRDPLLHGDMYREVYTYNHSKATKRLTEMCERVIEWLERHRDQITDRKVFGGDEH